MMTKLPQYRIRSDIRFQRVSDEGVVVRQSEANVLVLNEVGMSILEAIRDGATAPGDLVERLGQAYEVATEELVTDVAEFLRELVAAGVIETAAGPDSPA